MSSYTTQKETAQELREQLTARVDLRFGKYFGSVGTLYEFYCNSRSHALTRHNVILNASAGRKFGKENRLGLSSTAPTTPPRVSTRITSSPPQPPTWAVTATCASPIRSDRKPPELRCYFGLFRIVSHIFVSLDAETV